MQFGGLRETGEDTDIFGADVTAGAQTDLAEDDQWSQRPFGVVVGGRAVAFDEGKYFGWTKRSSLYGKRI